MPFVKALKNFKGTPDEGGFVTRGTEIEVTDERHRALAKNGLVTPPDDPKADAKKAPDPQNKMQQEPANKNITHASMQTRRVPLGDPAAAEKLTASGPKVGLNDPAAAQQIVDNSRPLAGGPTGAGNAPSSSPPARQPRRRTSTPSGGGRES